MSQEERRTTTFKPLNTLFVVTSTNSIDKSQMGWLCGMLERSHKAILALWAELTPDISGILSLLPAYSWKSLQDCQPEVSFSLCPLFSDADSLFHADHITGVFYFKLTLNDLSSFPHTESNTVIGLLTAGCWLICSINGADCQKDTYSIWKKSQRDSSVFRKCNYIPTNAPQIPVPPKFTCAVVKNNCTFPFSMYWVDSRKITPDWK